MSICLHSDNGWMINEQSQSSAHEELLNHTSTLRKLLGYNALKLVLAAWRWRGEREREERTRDLYSELLDRQRTSGYQHHKSSRCEILWLSAAQERWEMAVGMIERQRKWQGCRLQGSLEPMISLNTSAGIGLTLHMCHSLIKYTFRRFPQIWDLIWKWPIKNPG